MEENNWNEFEETNKNNLLILNLLVIFLQIFWEPNMTFIK